MAQDDDNSILDLSNSESMEEEDILLSEAELLGTAAGHSGTNATAGGTATTGKAATSKFYIPAVVQEKYPNLVPLILETESMDDEEREYWFQILPIMTPEQVEKFREILISEK